MLKEGKRDKSVYLAMYSVLVYEAKGCSQMHDHLQFGILSGFLGRHPFLLESKLKNEESFRTPGIKAPQHKP